MRKRILAFTLTLAMVVASLSALSFVTFAGGGSQIASTTPTSTLEATLNEVTLDGTLTATRTGEVAKAEYILSKSPINNTVMGAAYSLTAKKLYLALKLNGLGNVSASISVGGKTFTADFKEKTVTGGGEVAVSADGTVAEIAIPLEGLDMTEGDRYVTSPLNVVINSYDTFDGVVAFSNYEARYNLSKYQHSQGTISASGSDVAKATLNSGEGKCVLTDKENTNGSVYATAQINGISFEQSRDISWSFDLNVASLPITTVAEDGPSKFSKTPAPRIWMSYMNKSNESWFACIQNTATGLLLVVHTEDGGTTDQTVVDLGRSTGTTFNLELAWHDDKSMDVYVDGVHTQKIDNAMNTNTGLGGTRNILYFRYQRYKHLSATDSVDITYSNIVVNKANAAYDKAKLLELGATDIALSYTQESEVDTETNTFDVRFTATVNTLEAGKAGFEISLEGGKKADISKTTDSKVYKTILANVDGDIKAITAAEGEYLSSVTIKGVSSVGTYVFIVKPILLEAGSEKACGTTYKVTYKDGAFVSAVAQ